MEREEHLFEELCKKGKAYRAKRMAAGEKSSAYLSGRAVKVCKGQMQGESEEVKETNNIDPNNRPEFNQDEDNAYRYFNDLRDDGNFENPNELLKDLVNFLNIEPEEAKRILAQYLKDLEAEQPDVNVYEEIDALHENETYCPKCATKIKEAIREEIEKVAKTTVGDEMEKWLKTKPFEKDKKPAKEAKTKPAKGKRFAKKVKNPKTGRTRTVSYGQAGKAKKGGDRIRPGTAKGNAYCARSAKIKKCKNPPCANTLSRKKWKCQGSRSVK